MTDHRTSAPPGPVRLAVTVLVPFGIGYYLSYLYRTMIVVIAPDLVSEFSMGAADIGFMSSVFFITFAVVQLPVGVLLDRYGPRLVQTVLLLFAALGAALSAVADSFAALVLARACIGLGVAGCFMASLKVTAIWWPPARLPLVNNVIIAMGSFGALSATVPVEALLGVTDWRRIFLFLAVATVLLSALLFRIVPERRGGADRVTGIVAQSREVAVICRDPFFWRITPLLVLSMGVYLAYQTFWAGPWLRDVSGFDGPGTAQRLLLIQAGMLVGVLAAGSLADRLAALGVSPFRVLTAGALLFLAVQAALVLDAALSPALLWGAFGLFGATLFLSYSIISQVYRTAIIGRVNTATNMILFGFTFLVQWGIGAVIELWPALGVGRFDPAGHRVALAALLVAQALALLWFVAPRRDGQLGDSRLHRAAA